MLYEFKVSEFIAGNVIASYEARAVLIGDPITNPTAAGLKHDWELDCIEIRTPMLHWVKLPVSHRLHELAVNILHDERREIDKAWGAYLKVAA